MQTGKENPFTSAPNAGNRAQAPGLLGRILMYVAGAATLIVAFMFSVLFFAIVVAIGLVVWGYLWWKTRDLRKQMREHMATQGPMGDVIEGEIVGDVKSATTDDLDSPAKRGSPPSAE